MEGVTLARDGSPDHKTATALMDATERLLITHGYAGVSTRRVAEEAGQPHGLIRYHFGSLEALTLRTLDRAADRILDRQQKLYGGDEAFIDKWRTAMNLIDVDLAAGFPKLVAELFAKAWNDDVYREGLSRTMERFTDMLSTAVSGAAQEYGADLAEDDVLALATLIRTFQIGILIERLAGIDTGHTELLAAIDRRLALKHGGDDARPAT
ncbi:TetR/AcrR family transcriptional regulator [Salinactinospora qingdaonensis]|uniref:HTH tetR-type domain-containing protein n=1 Tax=Salinactinospora qingdaonensis TaxID=702744 RepID=A0ABP7F7U0_9ACTN